MKTRQGRERREREEGGGGGRERVSSPLSQVPSSMLRNGLRLICMLKSYNDHSFVKIYQKFPKFGNLGKIGNLNFPVRNQISVLRDHLWSSPGKKRKLKMGWQDATQYRRIFADVIVYIFPHYHTT